MGIEDKIKVEISKHEQKIKELKEQALKASGETKAKLETEIEELESKINEA
jgi:phage shock protein A